MFALGHCLMIALTLAGGIQQKPAQAHNISMHLQADMGKIGSLSLTANPNGVCEGSFEWHTDTGASVVNVAFNTLDEITYKKTGLAMKGNGTLSAPGQPSRAVKYSAATEAASNGKQFLTLIVRDAKTNAVMVIAPTEYK